MKRFLTIIMSLLLAFTVTACSSGGGSSNEVKGETFDMDTFTVLVPDGWVAKDYKDMDRVVLYKAESLDNTFLAPEIDITYKSNAVYNLMTSVFESYDNIDDITTGDYTWKGVQGKYDSTKELVALNTTVGEGYISADVWVKTSEDTTISLEDADVQAILSNIKIK